jgi:hypothetical protein
MDIKKQSNHLHIKPPKKHKDKKPDKLIWILGFVAILFVTILVVIFITTKTKSNDSQTDKVSIASTCPDVNKQHPGHCISSNISSLKLDPDVTNKYQFAVLDSKNQPIKNYDTVHEKMMHMIVIRKDLTDFQHIHPTLDQRTGIWTLENLNLPNDGPYRIFADFTPSDAPKDSNDNKNPITIYEDILVGDQSKYQAQKIGDATESKTFGDYDVLLQTKPMVVSANAQTTLEYLFLDTKLTGDQAITDLEPYLGAMGHAIVLSENLDFIHAHAMDDQMLNKRGIVDFMFTPPKQGKYKIFAQFKRRSQVFTTDFVLPVYKDLAPADVKLNSGNDAHSGHGQ